MKIVIPKRMQHKTVYEGEQFGQGSGNKMNDRFTQNAGYTSYRYMVGIVQLVRTSDCGSEGRGFKSHYSP